MTTPIPLQAAEPITLPPPTSAAAMLFHAAIQRGTTASGALVVEAVRGARRLGVSTAAVEIVMALPALRWSRAFSAARLQSASAAIWVEAPLPLPHGSRPGAASALGVLLLPRHDLHRRVTFTSAWVRTDGSSYGFDLLSVDEGCPLLRDPLGPNLVVAAAMFLAGELVGVEPPNRWGRHAELAHIIVPAGYGNA